ncbi:AAA family ATPase [Nonomuraea sp. NPDC046802]|uniref:AAA family ATPase n=1 Tax=Nonomuraea sp. NPDC046802 TaxID=3154919 RepID=UPI0033DFCE86
MPIRDCVVVAIEGTHASGKTTLVHALTSRLRASAIHAECTGEPARYSPFVEEVVLHGKGTFDLTTELDLFAMQLTTQLRAARHRTVLITDKTLANVIAYARLLLPAADKPALAAMTQLCCAVSGMYDAVFYCTDAFNPDQPGDSFRSKVADRQHDIDTALRSTCAETGIPLTDVPQRLTTAARVDWILRSLAERGVLPALA